MAGLGRVQQVFNRAIIGTLAALIGFARGKADKQSAANLAMGHPLLAKWLKSSNPNGNNPGSAYPGYCSGDRETRRRLERLNEGRLA
jgi:hypothetical protein